MMKVRSLVTAAKANVMALHLASKQVMPFAFAVKGIPFGKASLKLKRKATASEQGVHKVSTRRKWR